MAQGFYGKIGTDVNYAIRYKQFGNWDETIRTLQRLSTVIKEASILAQIEVCELICTIIKKHLVNQDLGWQPLSAAYAKKKEKVANADGRTLILWSDYYNAIRVWHIGNQHMVYIGVKKGVYGRDLEGKKTKKQIAEIAMIHEFSANSLLRRPLWNPTIHELGDSKGIKQLYLAALHKHLKIKGIPVKYKGGQSIKIDGVKFAL